MTKTEEDTVAMGNEQLELYARDVARLFESDHRRERELRHTNDATVSSLVVALSARDLDTEEHCRRIASWSVAIGRAMHVSESDLETLDRAAVLHDVGKIGVPDVILRKPGPLTDDEMLEMRQHPELGYRILRGQPCLGDTAAIIRHHHERYDGSGYPDHLRADAIPLGARIVAVADAFDAMTSHRPYRAAMDDATATAEIVRGRGHQFDPVVVDRFLDLAAERSQRRGDGVTPAPVAWCGPVPEMLP
jgi:HD-GYP domain-containing protein (c-di-GMP phosphodiesterase class II)